LGIFYEAAIEKLNLQNNSKKFNEKPDCFYSYLSNYVIVYGIDHLPRRLIRLRDSM